MPKACRNIYVAVIAPAMVTKRKAYTVITKLQTIVAVLKDG